VFVETPAVSTLRWNARPFPGLTSIAAWRDDGSSVSRSMTPALVQLATYCSLATRATIVPSPLSVV